MIYSIKFDPNLKMFPHKSTCSNLLTDCTNALKAKAIVSPKGNGKPISKTEGVAILDESLNQMCKQIKKMKHPKSKSKEVFIRKTDLGEQQLTFTPEEYQKLRIIDQLENQGLFFQEPATIQISQPSNQTAIQKLKALAIFTDIHAEIQSHLDWSSIPNQLLTVKEKVLGFTLRKKQALNPQMRSVPDLVRLEVKDTKTSLNKYYATLLNKITFGKEFLASDQSWEQHFHQNLTLPEKIAIIEERASKETEQATKEHFFMTHQRKQAIYQCNLLRIAKKQLGQEIFQKIQISVKEKHFEEKKQNHNQYQKDLHWDDRNTVIGAEEILQRNANRIEIQRKRIIEKLMC